MGVVVGIDLGTSSVKAVALDTQGRRVGGASRPLSTRRPHEHWAEQDPADWLEAAGEALRRLARVCDEERVLAVGCTGQMDGPVLLGEGGSPGGPVQLWCDSRCHEEVETIHGLVERQDLIQRTGKPAATGYTAPKLLWLRRHQPERLKGAGGFCLPKDSLVHALTGHLGTDPTDASNTLLFDLLRRTWDRDLAGMLGLDPKLLPEVSESAAVVGHVTRDAEAWSGLPQGTPVVAGAGDSNCAALACGLLDPASLQVVIGSAGNVNLVSTSCRVDASGRLHAGNHLTPGSWMLCGVQQAAGASLDWWARVAGRPPEVLLAEAEAWQERVGPQLKALFLPYLDGERTPHMDPHVRGAFAGLGSGTVRAELTLAVIEGVAFAFREAFDLLGELGYAPSEVVVAGGGARHGLWRRAVASVLGLEVRGLDAVLGEESACGAAMLAAIGVGAVASMEDAVARWVRQGPPQAPLMQPETELRYQAYLSLYPPLRQLARRGGTRQGADRC